MDDVFFLIQCGEHDDCRAVQALDQILRDGSSAAVGEADIQHDCVESAFVEELSSFFCGGSGDDRMTSLPQAGAQQFDHARVVLNDENAKVRDCFHGMFAGNVQSLTLSVNCCDWVNSVHRLP